MRERGVKHGISVSLQLYSVERYGFCCISSSRRVRCFLRPTPYSCAECSLHIVKISCIPPILYIRLFPKPCLATRRTYAAICVPTHALRMRTHMRIPHKNRQTHSHTRGRHATPRARRKHSALTRIQCKLGASTGSSVLPAIGGRPRGIPAPPGSRRPP